MIVGFKEFDNINQVECFKNMAILAMRDTLGELEENEVYLTDLIDMEVYNEEDEYRGIVVDIREYPQCYYLVVSNGDKQHLIPFIKEFVVDITEDSVIVHEMEGLFGWLSI